MAAFTAVRWEPCSQAGYRRLTARGKPHKVAMVAVVRSLARLLNTLLREDRLPQPFLPGNPLDSRDGSSLDTWILMP